MHKLRYILLIIIGFGLALGGQANAKTDLSSYGKAVKKCETKYKKDSSAVKQCKKKIKKPKSVSSPSTKKDAKDKASKSDNKYKDKASKSDKKYKDKASKTDSKLKDKASKSDKKYKEPSSTAIKKTKSFKPVKVNQATAQQLAESLPGIGEKKAKAIVEYRKKHGKFKKAEDLLKVSGIGDKTLKSMKPYLKF